MNTSVNPKVQVDPLHLAELFGRDNIDPVDIPLFLEVVQHFRAGRYIEGKMAIGRGPQPEFGVRRFYPWQQAVDLFRKVPFKGLDRRKAAWDTFLAAEESCGRANKKFADYSFSPAVKDVLARARYHVSRIVGSCPEGRILDMARPGSGVCIGTRNRYRVSAGYKIGDTDLICTRGAASLAYNLISSPCFSAALRDSDELTITEANRVSFVPKDAFTDRTIAIEPNLNVWLQLGVHEYLSGRLSRSGVSIRDQSVNRALARAASEGSIRAATIDLSSASDTVCQGIVKDLLPYDWWRLLNLLRSHYYVDPETKTNVRYEKFSSMGNGFTFALETVLFLGLARACNDVTGGSIASCYGDDIVISSESSLLLTEVLLDCGFSPNTKKSYYHGVFRESCGGNYISGAQVTTQKWSELKPRHTDVYNLLNRLDPCFRLGSVRTYLTQQLRASGKIVYGYPDEDTSSCLFTTHAYLHGAGMLRWNYHLQTWQVRTIKFVPNRERMPVNSGYAFALCRGGEGQFGTLREVGTFRLRFVTRGVPPVLPRFSSEVS